MTLAIVAAVALLVADYKYYHVTVLRSALLSFAAPWYFIASLPADLWQKTQEYRISSTHLRSDNARLKDENLVLRTQLQRLVALEAENIRLTALLGGEKRHIGLRRVAAVLAVAQDPFSHQLILNKGFMDHVYVGQPVLDAYGIMGQIIEVGPFTSRLLLISDASHAIPVRINRNGLRAIAIGTGRYDQLSLKHLPMTSDVKEGDLLVSSGLDQRFPEGFPVALVTHLQHDVGEPFVQVTAKPIAQLEQSHHVLLIWPERSFPDVSPSTAPDVRP